MGTRRVAIPKLIRQLLGINEIDQLVIIKQGDQIILKKVVTTSGTSTDH